jgi:NADP-dependent 3-hydroxy acid dehydrogenase YdfG
MKKIIFITGTSSGFGKLMTITLSKQGHHIIAGMRGTTGKNQVVAGELAQLPNVDVVEIDVTDDLSVTEAFEGTVTKHGRVDVLVNNAGLTGIGLLEAYSVDRIKRLFEVNFYGVIRTYQAVLPFMRKAKKGLIINLTSGASGHTLPFMIPYFASKFSVESVTEGMQEELEQFGIENVSIQPGVYPTEMNSGVKSGVLSDKPEITAEYEPFATEKLGALVAGLSGKMVEFKMDPQVIADGVLALVNMKDGTRPLRYPLDAIVEGTDREFIEARAAIKTRWRAKYDV